MLRLADEINSCRAIQSLGLSRERICRAGNINYEQLRIYSIY